MCQDSLLPAPDVRASNTPLPERIIAPNTLDGQNDSGAALLRVLVVDDHCDMLDMMEVMMRRRSFEVAKATSGEEALQLARDFSPDVVISDISMPGMDGYEMMAAMRAMQELNAFKSIALSGYDAQSEETRAQIAGYDAQLTKPVDFEKLLQTIATLSKPV